MMANNIQRRLQVDKPRHLIVSTTTQTMAAKDLKQVTISMKRLFLFYHQINRDRHQYKVLLRI